MRRVDAATDLCRVFRGDAGVLELLELTHFYLVQFPSTLFSLLVQFDPLLKELSPALQSIFLLAFDLFPDLQITN